MGTYPANPVLAQGTNNTALNTTNWNTLIDNINAIGLDLVTARADLQAFPGTDHTASQSTNIDDILQAIKHMLAEIGGETLWYTAPGANLKVHDHSSGKGGLVPWSSLGASNVRKVDIYPLYPGGVLITSLRGAAASGNNTITISNGVDVVSYVERHYYDGVSGQASLQDYYIALRFTLPIDFGSWASSNAIQVEYRTGSALSSDCHVDISVYKSGSATIITNSDNQVNVNWSNIGISGSALGTWSANDILEIYIKLESKNSNFARVGRVAFNYTS